MSGYIHSPDPRDPRSEHYAHAYVPQTDERSVDEAANDDVVYLLDMRCNIVTGALFLATDDRRARGG